VKIIQGYQGGTHQGRSRFGLDIVLADGSTSGAEVVAPADGTITWAQSPGAGNGCVAIGLSNGTHSVMLCHIVLKSGLNRGDKVTRGQSLGTVGKPGTVGNNGVAHIHYELHNDPRANSPVPFDASDGMLLEGVALPASSTTAVVAKRDPIVSSNRGGSGRTVPMSDSTTDKDKPAPIELVAASVPSAVRGVPAAGTRMAVVQGTDSSCLKVRKQPAADAPVVGCLKEGTEVALKPLASGADAKWRQTDQGWVSSDYLKRTQAVVAGTGDCLNVREAPKAGAKLLGCLKDGTGVTIVEGPTMAGGFAWYKVEGSESLGGKSGWAAGKYLD
jgi:hypothetical protein